jgi:enterochelin esterase-like enzyme
MLEVTRQVGIGIDFVIPFQLQNNIMKNHWKILLCTSATIIMALLGVGGWYVFVAGAPQLDPPAINEPNTGMKFRLESFNSKSMGEVREYGLILPPDYDKFPKKRYPVIFLLHGGHDDARAWYDKIGIIPVLHDLYQSGKLPPSIVITPDGNDKRGSSPLFDPDYYDGPNGKVGTLIGSELPSLAKSRYRTLSGSQFWAMGGLSSGGWGALNIGLHHLNNFNIFFSQIGYFTDSSGSENSPQSFISQIPAAQRKRLRIYLDAGLNDLTGPQMLNSTRQFHKTLKQLGIQHVFYTFPGGHGLSGSDYGWNYDHKHSMDSLSYVGQQFKIALQKQQ